MPQNQDFGFELASRLEAVAQRRLVSAVGNWGEIAPGGIYGQPGRHVRSRLERIDVGYGAQEPFLHEIVRAVDVAAE